MNRKSRLIIGWTLSVALLITSSVPVRAEVLSLQFTTAKGTVALPAEEIRKRLWVDFSVVGAQFGATRHFTKSGEQWNFPTHSVQFYQDGFRYRIKLKDKKTWRAERFEKRLYYDGQKPMVLIDALPDLCQQTLVYHRQRRTLRTETTDPTRKSDDRMIAVPYEIRDQKQWVSLNNIANELGLVIFSSKVGRYRLVLPDFSIVELRVGDNNIYKQDTAYTRLTDPLLLFSGSPYLTVSSLGALLGTGVHWDESSKKLAVPVGYGRFTKTAAPVGYRLRYEGIAPKPFSFSVDEFTAYYQTPEPIFSADHSDVYESVRDFFTNEPIHSNSNNDDHFSGNVLLETHGNTAGIPFEGKGSFEKIGDASQVVNASAKWGFPLFQIAGGREYETFGGFNNQFNVVDRISLSHSNDHFGDGDKNPNLHMNAAYGSLGFSIFLSTETFSQTVKFKQSYVSAGLDTGWRWGDRQRLSLKLDQYLVTNKTTGRSASYLDTELFGDIFDGQIDLSVDQNDQAALAQTVLTPRHATSLLSLTYQAEDIVQFDGTLGMSNFKDKRNDKRVWDTDHMERLIIGNRKRRVETSYEHVGKNFRSLGSPMRYMDRSITRVAPYIDITRIWKVLGEYRREDIASLKDQGVVPYTNATQSASNIFALKGLTIRGTWNAYDSNLYGSRKNTDLNLTKYLGRHSLNLGGGPGSQHLSNGALFRRSATGRAGLQLLGDDWKFSLGEEYTRSAYEISGKPHRFESLSTMVFNFDQFRSLVQYERKPKYYSLEDILYTGLLNLGWQVKKDKSLNIFYAGTSLNENLSHPVVWRTGLEFKLDFQ